MATITVIQPSIMTETTKRRVVAYCRVSSSSEDQLNSYQAQLTYYSHKFENSTTEELVDLYADEGITGTREDKRDEFQRMMKDCRRGKIDRIYTKSISRFARNTKDCLKNLRELKSLGITVMFEKENIDTANMTDEIMITILSGLAQEESVSISKNMKWSYRKRMESGRFVTNNAPFGYRLENHRLVVHEQEAEVVREIFAYYLSGHGAYRTALHINEKYPQFRKWNSYSIQYMLKNEKYIGDALLQKTYTPDSLGSHSKENRGQESQFYVEQTHEPIIEKSMFTAAQELLQSQRIEQSEYQEHHFSRKIRCMECGHYYRRKHWNGITYWICTIHDRNTTECSSVRLREKEIEQAFMTMHNKLLYHYRSILLPIQQMLQELKCKKYDGNAQIMDIHKEIAKLREQNHVIARLRTKGFMDDAKFQEQTKELNAKIKKLQAELKKLTRSDDEDDVLEKLDMLIDYFEKREQMMVSFEPDTFDSMVDRITADNTELTFHLLGGIELKEKV